MKVLKLDDESGKEISKYTMLFGDDEERTLLENNLVFCSIINFNVSSEASLASGSAEKNFKALLMDYLGVLSDIPILPGYIILSVGLKIKKALEFIHAKGYAHMDVKDSNIFHNPATGQCLLGDYGSCVAIGSVIESTTAGYYPISLHGLAARAEYDFYMLAVCLCLKLEKSNNPNLPYSHFFNENGLVEKKLFDYVRGLIDSDLKALLLELFQIKDMHL